MKRSVATIAAIVVLIADALGAARRAAPAVERPDQPTYERVGLYLDASIVTGVGGHQHNQVLVDAIH
jgi:hypothetical protein